MPRRGAVAGSLLLCAALVSCSQRDGTASPAAPSATVTAPPSTTAPSSPSSAPSSGPSSGPRSTGTGTATLLGPPVVAGGGPVEVTYPGGPQVTWRANRDGLPWAAPGAAVESAAPTALVAAVRRHLDSRRATGLVAEATRSVGGRTATRELRWRWADGDRVGAVVVLVSRGLMEPEARPDPCSTWPAAGGPPATTRCRVLRSPAGTVVVGDVRRAGAGADVSERVAFTVREDGVVVSARAATQTDRLGEVGGVPPPLDGPPLSERQLVDLVLDPAVGVGVGPAGAS